MVKAQSSSTSVENGHAAQPTQIPMPPSRWAKSTMLWCSPLSIDSMVIHSHSITLKEDGLTKIWNTWIQLKLLPILLTLLITTRPTKWTLLLINGLLSEEVIQGPWSHGLRTITQIMLEPLGLHLVLLMLSRDLPISIWIFTLQLRKILEVAKQKLLKSQLISKELCYLTALLMFTPCTTNLAILTMILITEISCGSSLTFSQWEFSMVIELTSVTLWNTSGSILLQFKLLQILLRTLSVFLQICMMLTH